MRDADYLKLIRVKQLAPIALLLQAVQIFMEHLTVFLGVYLPVYDKQPYGGVVVGGSR